MNLGKKKKKVKHPDAVPVKQPKRIPAPNWPAKKPVPVEVPLTPERVGA